MSIRQGNNMISPVLFVGDHVKVVKLTKTAYNILPVKDPLTIYAITKDTEL